MKIDKRSRFRGLDLTGIRMDWIEVLEFAGRSEAGYRLWKCRCDCGLIVIKSQPYLTQHLNTLKTCGCISRCKNITGVKVNRLTAIKCTGRKKGHDWLWLWKCDCGAEIERTSGPVLSGNTTSCGCKQSENGRNLKLSHGGRWDKQYSRWNNMHSRCYDINNKQYHNYGGRGIEVEYVWHNKNPHGYLNFKSWLKDNGWSKNSSNQLDRIDVDGNYCPENCRLVSSLRNNNNRTNNKKEFVFGEELNISQACDLYKLNFNRVYKVRKEGYSLEEAVAIVYEETLNEKN